MSAFIRRGFLQCNNILVQTKRFRGKINIQRPRAPHFERAVFNAATEPIFLKVPVVQQCRQKMLARLEDGPREKRTHPYERILAREIRERFDSSAMILVCHLNSIKEYDLFKIRVPLHQKGVTLKRYGPRLIKIALRETRYESMLPLLESSYCLLLSPEKNINHVLPILRKTQKLILLGGVLDNRYMSRNQLVEYSQLPSLDVARAQFAATLHLAGNSIVNKLQAHQSNLCSLLDLHAKALGEPAKEKDAAVEKTEVETATSEKPPEDPK